MSIGQVGPAGKAGDYYTHQDNYYVLGSMDERWVGQGAEALGLSWAVKLADFVSVLEGRLPDGGDLSRMKDGRNAHRPGYDLTFSAPKSVSIMALPGGDKRLVAAHNRAVEVALREVEKLASTRSMTAGVSETRLTGNLVVAMFNHDTSRDLDPQLHTHAVENVGPHGMWEFQGMEAVIGAFSKRRHSIRDAVGEDASLKSRDMETLDTRKAKVASDPATLVVQWLQEMKDVGFDAQAYREAARGRTLVSPAPTPLQAGGEAAVDEAVSRAISALSDRQVNFTHTALLNKTLSYLTGEPTILDAVRAGIDRAVAHDRLIPLDREKGVFTSDIHLLDELSVAQLSRPHLNAGAVTVSPGCDGPPAVDAYSDAVSQLAQARPTLAVLSGIGGASVNRARVVEVVTMARAQGREARVLTADRTSQAYLQQASELGEGGGIDASVAGQ